MSSERAPERRPDDGRRAELVDAAIRVVAREGFAAATTRRIAAEAQVPLGLVHYWFSGKDELVEQVVAKLLAELTAATTTEPPAHDPAQDPSAATPTAATSTAATPTAEDVLRQFQAVFDVVRHDEPGRQLSLYELTVLGLRTPSLRDSVRRQYDAYRETAAAAFDSWPGRENLELPGSPETVAQFIATLFDGVTLAWLADPDGTRPDDIFAFVSELLTGYHRSSPGATP